MNEYGSLPTLFKYVSDDRVVLKGIFQDHTIRFTQPGALNDPLDCNPILKVPYSGDEYSPFMIDGVHMPSVNFWYHIQLVESHINEYGILSLTKNPVSADMWNLYSNGHKGCLLEFKAGFNLDAAFCSTNGTWHPIEQVSYVDPFLVDLGTCLDDSGSISIQKFREKYFYSKELRWEREQEFRLVRPLSDLDKPSIAEPRVGVRRDYAKVYLGPLPLSVVESVTFGARMSKENKRWIMEQCRASTVRFLQAVVFPLEKDDEGRTPLVKLFPLEDPVTTATVLELNPELLLHARGDTLNKREIVIDSLAELPYYVGFERLVSDMYSRLKRASVMAKEPT